MPSNRQIFGAKIRAEEEKYYLKHRKLCDGGYLVPSHKEKLNHLAKKFVLTPVEISYFLTYSRKCTHSWSTGACDACPD